jgi:hypothetical protein
MRPPLSSIIIALAAGFAMPASADGPGRNGSQPPIQVQLRGSPYCVCRAPGRTFEVGQTACLQTPNGPRLAECSIVINNTSWRFTDSPCPET